MKTGQTLYTPVALLALGMLAAQATEYRWTGSLSTNWSDGANWTPANPPNDGTADILFTNYTGLATVATGTGFNPDIRTFTVRALNDADSPLTTLGGGTITVRGGEINKAIATGGDTVTFNTPLALAADTAIGFLGINGANKFAFAGEVGEVGGSRSLRTWGVGASAFTAPVPISGELVVENYVTTGTTVFQINDDSSSLPNVSRIRLRMPVHGILDIRQDDATDRVRDAAPIDMDGGALQLTIADNANDRSETVGPVTVRSGLARLANTGGTGAGKVLWLASVTRMDGVRGILRVDSSANNRVDVLAPASLTAQLVGGGGLAGSPTVSILPWTTGNGNGVPATYQAGVGLRALDTTTEFYTTGSATSIDTAEAANGGSPYVNVIDTVASQTLSGNRAINVFRGMAATTAQSIASDTSGTPRTLTIHGGVFAANLNTTVDITLHFPNEAVIQIMSVSRNITLTGGLTGTNGLTFYGQTYGHAETTGLKLNNGAANQLTGPYTVVNGTLGVSASESIPNSVAVTVHEGATFALDNGKTETVAAIAGRGRAAIGSATSGANRTLVIGSAGAGQVTGGGIRLDGGRIEPADSAPGVLELNASSGKVVLTSGTLAIPLRGADQRGAETPRLFGKWDAETHGRVHVYSSPGNIEIGSLCDIEVDLDGYTPAADERWGILTTASGAITAGTGTGTGTAGFRAIVGDPPRTGWSWRADLWDSDGDSDMDAVVLVAVRKDPGTVVTIR